MQAIKGSHANRFNCAKMSKTVCPITIRFRDTDTMGHVNNAVYLSYFELARMDYFDKMMDSRWDWTKDGIILARNEIDYLAPIFLLDKIHIETEVVHVGNSSFTMAYQIFKETPEGPQCCTRAKATLVCYDFSVDKKAPVPEAWRAFMTA